MTIYRCDNCGNEVQDSEVKMGWLEVTNISEVLTMGEDDSDLHFCSWRCTGLYAFERTGAVS